MIHIDNDTLQFAGMLCAVLERRQIRWKPLDGEKTNQGSEGNNSNYLIANATYSSSSFFKDEKDVLAFAVKNGIKNILLINEFNSEFGISSEKNGKLLKINLKSTEEEYDKFFGVYLIASIIQGDEGIVAQDEKSNNLIELAKRVAASDVGVFINGPTGTGKEVLANFLHQSSRRTGEQFVAINCAAIPGNMLEAMLFGHVKGAFTGASTASKGIFRAADKGTLLLDEISEMPISLQAKLLRMLQERAVTPVGDTSSIPCDVRVIATSNCDMEREIQEGRFREDLFYRLNVFPIETAALKERTDDIIPLATHMLVRHLEDYAQIPYITAEAAALLEEYEWPGNVRELENVMQRAFVLSNKKSIEATDILIPKRNANERIIQEKLVSLEDYKFSPAHNNLEETGIYR
tara:strand:- start:209 stop:1426 length:1218 start_codon:yes stop_codon:yes gene_type:complete